MQWPARDIVLNSKGRPAMTTPTVPLPTGWQNVTSNSPASLVSTCAALLASSTNFTQTAQHKGPTVNNLTTLLGKTYTDSGAGGQSLFYLYYCDQATVSGKTTSPLCVAFYKTIKTFGGGPSASASPTRRWWCITVGVPYSTPANGWSYTYVKNICTYFYYTVVQAPANQQFGDILVLAEDPNRTQTNYEVDACMTALGNDNFIQQLNPFDSTKKPPYTDTGYKPWKQVLQTANQQINFTQLTF
jgi:hypothetical protein